MSGVYPPILLANICRKYVVYKSLAVMNVHRMMQEENSFTCIPHVFESVLYVGTIYSLRVTNN